jgi:two-component system sensor histidine kinase ComP
VVVSGSGADLVIKVSDHGEGFNPNILDSTSQIVGFGLLSLRERASHMGGSLVIQSTPGQGSCFTLTVPIRPDSVG